MSREWRHFIGCQLASPARVRAFLIERVRVKELTMDAGCRHSGPPGALPAGAAAGQENARV